MSQQTRLLLLGTVSAAMVLAAAFFPPIPQPQEYHQFADHRLLFGMPNFLNVISNVPFLLVGAAGLMFLLYPGASLTRSAFVAQRIPGCAHKLPERWPYLILFLGVVMTCFGSAYYHWAPDNASLVWDRLPMAVGFMALLAAMLAERVSLKAGLWLLPFLIAVGAWSVMHWHWTEQRGAGNLNFYLVVQFCSLLLIILLSIFFPPKYSRGADLYVAIAFYGAAKLAEFWDLEIYALGQVISGHTAKHLLAALAVYWILRMLQKRTLLTVT